MESKDMVSSCLDKEEQELQRLYQLKKQLDKEELHEYDSKACLAVLKKQFDTFFDPKSHLSYSYQYQSDLARQKENFQEIDERACHEEELRIKEQNVKEKRNEGKNSSSEKDTDTEGAKISKNISYYDITIAKSSHDKDKTEVQWSNNGLFENDHEVEKTNENNKALKEANDLLTKELKTYKEKVRVIEISKANNTTFFNEFIKVDSKARRLQNDLQNQFIRDRDIIRDLEQQRDNLQLQISYQKGHISSVSQEQDTLKANLKHCENKYLNDILQLQAINKDLENIVCKMGKSTKTLRLLTNEQRAYRDSILQRSRVETYQCDEVKVKFDFDEIETKNIELEHQVALLLKENEQLNVFQKTENKKVVLEQQLAYKVDDSKVEKDQFLKEINHLKTQLENMKGKSVETKFDKPLILGKPPAGKLLITSQLSKSWFTPKVVVQKNLSKPATTQSLPKNEKGQLLKRIASLESKLPSQDLRFCQKEYHELRTLYNALKVKFDSLNRTKRKTNVFNSSKPKVNVSEKVYTGESSNPFSKRVSQFTTYSLQKDTRFSKKSQTFETSTSQKVFKKSALNGKSQVFETPISQKNFKTSASNAKNQVFETLHSRFTPVKQVWKPKQSHSKSFKYSKSEMLSMQNKNDSASTINKRGRFSNSSKLNF
ncbi:hypothetical protein Tco_0393123 [Tanacetum coccineum]